ncbi:MAG: hypothetical protein ACFFCL_12265, partial [Promethearchaeota archaeon]
SNFFDKIQLFLIIYISHLQKLIDAALIVNPEEMFKILESLDEGAQELVKKVSKYTTKNN